MKFRELFILILISILFFSCSNGKTAAVEPESITTIKSIIKEKEMNENWTRELEPGRLSTPLTSEYISTSIIYTEDSFKAAYANTQPVYPYKKNFGSLDISLINKKSLESLNNFCSCVKEDYSNKLGESFSQQYIFNAVFFMKTLEDNWELKFGESFPVKQDDKKTKLFETYFIGKPEVSDNSSFIEVPVLFSSQNKKVYVKILLDPEEESKIYQAIIYKWETQND